MNTRTDHASVKDLRVDRARFPLTQISSSYVRSCYLYHVPISSILPALRHNLTFRVRVLETKYNSYYQCLRLGLGLGLT